MLKLLLSTGLAVFSFIVLSTSASAVPCWMCVACDNIGCTSERCAADNTTVTSNIHVETSSNPACGCEGVWNQTKPCTVSATGSVTINNATKYSVTGTVNPEGFGLSAGWESQTTTQDACSLTYTTHHCGQSGGVKAGRVYTDTRKWGVEDCIWPESDDPYDTTLRELTGCYTSNFNPECSPCPDCS